MGATMTTRLVQAELKVTLWDHFAAAYEPLVALGATRAEEVDKLFSPGVIINILTDDRAVHIVLLDSGALERTGPGLIHLSMLTLSFSCVEVLDQVRQRRGITLVIVPVFDRTNVAGAGKLNTVIGDPEETIKQVKTSPGIMEWKT